MRLRDSLFGVRGEMIMLPLDGVRVVDLTRAYAGAGATRLLGDMGAEIIKVESCRIPDVIRGDIKNPDLEWLYPDNDPGEKPYNRAARHHGTNRNKYAITIELDMPDGIDIFIELVKISDVVISSFPVGTMEGLGLSYEKLKQIKPEIIVACMSAFGEGGPESGYRAFGVTQFQLSGLANLFGYPNEEPIRNPMSPGDTVGAVNGAIAIMLALIHRKNTGKGQYIDLSQLETMVSLIGETVMDYTVNGVMEGRVGNRSSWIVPHGCYPCKGEDEWVSIAVASDKEWHKFCQVSDHLEWAEDERFADLLSRWENQEQLDKLVADWTVKYSKFEIMQMLQKEDIACMAVVNNKEMYSDPQLQSRGFYVDITHPEIGTYPFPGVECRLSETPGSIRMPAPDFAEHNDYIFKELLGMDDVYISKLRETGVIGDEPVG